MCMWQIHLIWFRAPFYGMICLSIWEMQTRSQPFSLYWRLISPVGAMIEGSLAQGWEGERQDTGATNCPCCLCLAVLPGLSTGILCLWPYYRGWVTGLLVLFHAITWRGASLEWVESLTWSSCLALHPLGLVRGRRSSRAILSLVSG